MKFKVEYGTAKGVRRQTVEATSADEAQRMVKAANRATWQYHERTTQAADKAKAPTRSELKEALPAKVWAQLESILPDRVTISGLTFHAPNTGLYLDEDTTYRVSLDNGETWATRRMAGEWNMSASSVRETGHMVGRDLNLPAGAWAIENGIFLGKRMTYLHHWSLAALAEGAK